MVNLQNNKLRQEKKYIIKPDEINFFEKNIILSGFRLKHLHNKVNNIYFDDSNQTAKNENIEGDLFRSKHRIRWYNNEKVFILENKIKKSSSGYKENIK